MLTNSAQRVGLGYGLGHGPGHGLGQELGQGLSSTGFADQGGASMARPQPAMQPHHIAAAARQAQQMQQQMQRLAAQQQAARQAAQQAAKQVRAQAQQLAQLQGQLNGQQGGVAAQLLDSPPSPWFTRGATQGQPGPHPGTPAARKGKGWHRPSMAIAIPAAAGFASPPP